MNNKNLERLVIALRSGKYKQGKGFLNKNDELFCCLGVACEVAIENGVNLKKSPYLSFIKYDETPSYLPKKVMDFFGLKTISGEFEKYLTGTYINSLSLLNDSGKSFNMIANFIENNEESLCISKN